MTFRYSKEMVSWAKENVPGRRMAESLKMFNQEFNQDKKISAWATFCKSRNILTGMPRHKLPHEINSIYTPEMLAWVQEQYRQQPMSEFINEFNSKFGMNLTVKALLSACKRFNIKSGRDGRFLTGNESWNKGVKMPFNANSAKTQFKKGRLPHNTKQAGHERTDKDGYVWISVNEKNPHTGFERSYVHKHRHLWKLKNGPIPDGMVLKCMDGNKQNCKPSNWQLIDRALLPKLTKAKKFERLPNDLKPTVINIVKLESKIEKVKRA